MEFKVEQIVNVLNLSKFFTNLIIEMENELGDKKLLAYQSIKIIN